MRILTRADLDGIVAAAMIMEHEEVNDILFVHPKDMQDGLVDVQKGDILSNLPLHPNASMWFDHHNKAEEVEEMPDGVRGKVGVADSAARIVYEYYGKAKLKRYREMLDETDRLDSATLTHKDVLDPDRWILLGYTLDPRSGFGRFREYSMEIINAIREGMTINEMLELPGAKARIAKYFEDQEAFKAALSKHTKMVANVSVTDFRGIADVPKGNRFMVFALFDQCNINVRLYDHRDEDKVMCAVGKSIFDRSHPTHVGQLMDEYGGGGLPGAGTCPIQKDKAEKTIKEIIGRLTV